MLCIRGAVTAKNTIQDIGLQSTRLMAEIFSANNLAPQQVSAVLFTVTKDLTVANPCTAVRKGFGMDNAAFMCMQEADIDGGLSGCIRVLVLGEGSGNGRFVYLDGAKNLRK